MNKLIYKIAVLFMAVSLVSCEKGLMNFDNENADIYFSDAGKAPTTIAYDSVYVSFSYTKALDSVRNIVVAVTGGRVDHDREYSLMIDPSSTAIEGTHYEPLPEKFVIRKNALADTIKLKLLKTPDMQTASYLIVFDLFANENFGTSWKSRLVASKPMSTIRTKIAFNNIIRKPKYWNDGWFGAFSQKKLFFICEFLEITPQYMDTSIPPAEVSAYAKMVQRRLDRLASEGKTVYEDNGTTPMTMAPAAK
jgi:hypothetical protein